jgi:prevent-host-death family protein
VRSVTTREAKTHLSRLLAEVEQGEEIVICRGTVPAARLLKVDPPLTANPQRPKVGAVTSSGVGFSEDTFAPLSAAELEVWGL